MPIQMLWKLRLPLVQRLGLCVVLSMGAIAVFASMYRTCFYLLFHGSFQINTRYAGISTLHLIFRSPDDTCKILILAVLICVSLFNTCREYHISHRLVLHRTQHRNYRILRSSLQGLHYTLSPSCPWLLQFQLALEYSHEKPNPEKFSKPQTI